MHGNLSRALNSDTCAEQLYKLFRFVTDRALRGGNQRAWRRCVKSGEDGTDFQEHLARRFTREKIARSDAARGVCSAKRAASPIKEEGRTINELSVNLA